jgi:predicted adenine nucleotide alpha hydrolase (AANH) superfamily ATPase
MNLNNSHFIRVVLYFNRQNLEDKSRSFSQLPNPFVMYAHVIFSRVILYTGLQNFLKYFKDVSILTLDGNQCQICFSRRVKSHSIGDDLLKQQPFDLQEYPLHP